MTFRENLNFRIAGQWKDTLIYPDGRKVEGKWSPNQIQNGAALIVAGLAGRVGEIAPHNAPIPFTGISYMAIGSGLVGWDTVAPAQPKTDLVLETEYFRKSIGAADMQFVDPTTPFAPSALPTRCLEVAVTLMPSEANGAMREFALFGGSAGPTLDSGEIFNWVIHPLINKESLLLHYDQL